MRKLIFFHANFVCISITLVSDFSYNYKIPECTGNQRGDKTKDISLASQKMSFIHFIRDAVGKSGIAVGFIHLTKSFYNMRLAMFPWVAFFSTSNNIVNLKCKS